MQIVFFVSRFGSKEGISLKPQDTITKIKGIGEKTAALFHKLEIQTVDDLVHNYPRAYDIFEAPVCIAAVEEAKTTAVKGVVMRNPEVKQVKNLQVVTVQIKDETGVLPLTWFNMPFLRNTLKAGYQFIFRGSVIRKMGRLVMQQPEMYSLGAYEELVGSMQPIYGLTKGLTNKMVVKAVAQYLEQRPVEKDYMPLAVRQKNQLAEYNFAIQHIHFPKDRQELLDARKRLVFDEFFFFLLTVRQLKDDRTGISNPFIITERSEVEQLKDNLPYQLTKAQEQVLDEIMADLTGNRLMNRLVQGDVGSGKTIVAVLALLQVALNGYQGALMAPTEVLARQHYESVTELFAQNGITKTAVLITGSMTAKEKRLAYEKVASHEADLIIGTHALIQEKVVYDNLALVITDEQHRFGVKQREALGTKGVNPPHVLVMSATPIPRTLAVILYGDLDISVIDELPANRLPIKNCVIPERDRKKAYHFLEKEVFAGRQVYVICPMVEESEMLEAENVTDYTKELRKNLTAGIVIDYLHGKMKGKEKNQKMEDFAAGKIQILVSTTVIEVGVNVPNATVMMVENSERFGLAQLHQLRGRVGRGSHQSYCIFVTGSDTKETKTRLDILVKSNDGFYIASEDLKLRGPGDILGLRQSGLMEFRLGDIFTDAAILKAAQTEAGQILDADPELSGAEHSELKRELLEYKERGMNHISL